MAFEDRNCGFQKKVQEKLEQHRRRQKTRGGRHGGGKVSCIGIRGLSRGKQQNGGGVG